jgi:hypothetical protein
VDATFPVTISAKEVRQTYGSSGAPASGIGPSGGGGASVPVWLLVLAAVLLLVIGIGGSTAYQRRRPQHH